MSSLHVQSACAWVTDIAIWGADLQEVVGDNMAVEFRRNMVK